jgi:hypothetical protein
MAGLTHIVEGFKNLSLPKEEWTHAAHLVTGMSLIYSDGLTQAERDMPDMIRAYNASKGGINSDTEGYHHTITIFYLKALAKFSAENTDLSLVEKCQKLLNSSLADREYLRVFYSKDLLFSIGARKSFLLPDRQNL